MSSQADPEGVFQLRPRIARRALLWAILLTGLALIYACGPPNDEQFASNGERIYFTSTSESGDPIWYENGPFHMRMPLDCADCHGADGTGGRVTIMKRTFEAPDITWSRLTEPHDDHGEEAHPPYDEQSLRRAIAAGMDPAGHEFDELMPRWSMSESDLDDLVEFLVTLGGNAED
jgi:cytochrome c oxidase subunit II